MTILTKGDFNEYSNAEVIELDVFGGVHQTYVVSNIDTKGALELTVQITNGIEDIDTGTITQGDSTNLTVIFYGDVGLGYTTVPIGVLNMGANSSDMWFGITGHYKLKILFDNLDKSYSTKVSYKVVVKK